MPKGKQHSKKFMLKAQGWHRLEKYMNSEGFLEKSLKIKSALKSTGKSLRSLEKSLNFTIFQGFSWTEIYFGHFVQAAPILFGHLEIF